MKKIFLLILGFVMFKVGYSQYPIQQFIGADSAVVTSKGGMQGRFINVVFPDTTTANSQRIRQYAGAMIYAAGKLWVRNTTATGWNELAYNITPVNIYNSNGSLTSNRTLDGDGYSLTFDQIGGEFGVGADSINFAPASGKFRISSLNQGIGTRALRYNPVTKLITYSDTTSSVNIYNSDGTLTGNRELDADGNNLTFTAVRKFSLSGDSLDYTLDPAGNLRIGLGNQQFIMRSDTASLSRRISYTGNLGSSFTKHSLVDRNYVDSSITASPSGTVTSVGLSMPTAFAVANSPVTSSGTITVTGAGVASQYIRGDGQLATLPTTGGGGSSVSYYLNGSVNQGTFGGTPYYEMSKTPIFGAGTDFTISSNGYIASFITDAGDPALLNIPAGNWDFEVYFQSSSASGTPSFYVELYKYDGTTFTLIASSSANPEFITGGTSVDAYYTPLAVPSTSLAVTDRLAVRIYVNNSGNTITLHTEDNNLCQIITTFSTGINALNGLTSQVQYFATGTSGTDFNINSLTDTHTFNLPTASATNRGALSSADWSTFNSKIGPSDTASMLSNYVTNAGYGLLKTTKTLSVDTLLISTRAWRQKGIDSVTSLINARPSGSGTTNYVSKWTSSSALGNSQIFDNGTNVGIGIATPAVSMVLYSATTPKFQLQNSTSSTLSSDGFQIALDGADGYLWNFENGTMRFGTNATERMRLTAAGRLLLGTTTESTFLLDCNGTARFTGNVGIGIGAGSNALQVRGNFYADDGNGYYGVINATNGGWFISNMGNSAARISSTFSYFLSNTAIGTSTDAGYRLDVNGTARVSGTELRLDNGTTGTLNIYSNTPSIQFFSSDPTGYRFYRSGTGMFWNSSGSITTQISGNDAYTLNASSGHVWRTGLSGGNPTARLTTGGNLIVGGITDAGYRADIQGTLRINHNGYGIVLTNTSANRIQWIDNGTFRWAIGSQTIQGGELANSFNFYSGTNSSTQVSIAADGAVMIGVAFPISSNYSPSAILQAASTTRGFLPPRMTNAQMVAIATPASGLMVYDTTNNKLNVYDGTNWVTLH
jgi:hypothetical protein